MAAFLLFACVAIPRIHNIRDIVDVIEVNHVVGPRGALVLDQVIFWRWVSRESHYRVVAWRHLRGVREYAPKQVEVPPDGWKPLPQWNGGHATPIRRRDRGGWWVSQWKDEKDRCWREVAAPMFRETWTLHDPEIDDREFLPKDQRKGLRSPKR